MKSLQGKQKVENAIRGGWEGAVRLLVSSDFGVSLRRDRRYHSFDSLNDLYFELRPEYNVFWSDHLPFAITLQSETEPKLPGTFSEGVISPCPNG